MSDDPGSANNKAQPMLRARTFNEARHYLMAAATCQGFNPPRTPVVAVLAHQATRPEQT